MANYYMKNSNATRMYRLNYAGSAGSYVVSDVRACGTGTSAVLPDGQQIVTPDQTVEPTQVIVDMVLNNLVQGTLAEYRTLAKAMIDASW